jgi:hypothetical protein
MPDNASGDSARHTNSEGKAKEIDMQERTLELDAANDSSDLNDALQSATERAERAENALARLRAERQPPSPGTAENAPRSSADEDRDFVVGGEEELRKDPMMARLLDALGAGEDVGHYGRLVFAMVARHFLTHEQVHGYLVNDRDFSEPQAKAMLQQVDSRDYNPPKRERLIEWQSEQSFQFMDPNDPDSGNLYRNLKFPHEIYDHIEHYQEEKSEAA